MKPNVLLTDSVFEAISPKRYHIFKTPRVDLAIVVRCPRCEREVTDEKSHEHCELLQKAIEEKDPLLVFLHSLTLQDLFPLLKQEEVTMELLLEFESEEMLERIGIKKIAHRLRLIDAIADRRVSEKRQYSQDCVEAVKIGI